MIIMPGRGQEVIPHTYNFPVTDGFAVRISEMKRKGKINTRADVPCPGIMPERRHPLIPTDKREPTDEPCLPGDPGDEPDD